MTNRSLTTGTPALGHSQPMAALLGELRGKPVNASRIHIEPRRLYGKPDGTPAIVIRDRFVPQTGIAPIDRTTEKVASVTRFGQNSVRNMVLSTLKGSFYGTACGLLIASITQWRSLGSLFTKKLPWPLLTAAGLFGVAGSFIGGGVGFLQGVRKNLGEFKQLLKGTASAPARTF